jgi:hypothetical protein
VTAAVCLIVIAAACGEARPKCGYAHDDPPYCVDPPEGYRQVKGLPNTVAFGGLPGEIFVSLEPAAIEGTFADWVASRTDDNEATPLPGGNGVMVLREDRLGTSSITFLETYLDVAPGKVVVCRANGTTGRREWPSVIEACKSLRRR